MTATIIRGAALALALAASPPAPAQAPPAQVPAQAPPAQVPTAPAETPPAPPAASPVTGAQRTLAPNAADPSNPDEVALSARPVVVVSGTSAWAEGFTSLKGAFERLDAELTRTGLKAAGRPLALFTQTEDAGFRYDAMIPVEEGAQPTLGPDFRLGRTPEGKAVRFVHKGPYDDIDTTYETVTAYLDVKGVAVKDTYLEEYLGDLAGAADPVEVNIYALPR